MISIVSQNDLEKPFIDQNCITNMKLKNPLFMRNISHSSENSDKTYRQRVRKRYKLFETQRMCGLANRLNSFGEKKPII